FPEPDLVPLRFDPAWVDGIRAALPELPRARRQRLVDQYGLPAYDADVLTQSRALADYFEATVAALGPERGSTDNRATARGSKAAANWVISEFLRQTSAEDEDAIRTSPVSPPHL